LLWTGTDESNWLGWLKITEEQLAHIDAFKEIAADVKKSTLQTCLVAGHGWFQPLPEVLRMTFGKIKDFLNCTFWIPRIPRKLEQLRPRWTSEHDLHRVEQIRKHAQSRISTSNTFLSA